MTNATLPIALVADQVPDRTKPSVYPEPFKSMMAGRFKKVLGDPFALTNFGVNLTRLLPGARSSMRHAHTLQDEFIYILQGTPTLVTNAGETPLQPGMCAGFKAGTGDGHHLLNRSAELVVYLEVGDRTAGDAATYPDDDIEAEQIQGAWKFTHKDGTPY